MKSLELVREFHRVYGQSIADAPHVDDRALNELRIKLLTEELKELAEALGFKLDFTIADDVLPTDKVETLDALTDLQYVLDGAYLSLGFHALKDAALVEVHRSNMSKLGDDGRPVLREDGKILKGPRFSRPNLAAVLASLGIIAGLLELRDAPALDLRIKHALTIDAATPGDSSCATPPLVEGGPFLCEPQESLL